MFLAADDRPSPDLRPPASGIAASDWAILADYWYPVAIAADLADGPVAVQLLDVPLALFRGSDDVPALVLDLCPHRHIALSGGRVVEGEIECPFHGLRFDAGGRCRRVPALGREAKLPDRYRVRTFPVEERYGLLWTCIGDPTRRALPTFASMEGCDAADLAYSVPLEWPVSPPRQVENFIDLAHLPFVHADTLGGDPAAAIQPARVEHDDTGFTATTRYVESGADGAPVPVDFRYRVVLPFAVEFRTRKVERPDEVMDSCDIPVPIGAHRSMVFQILRHSAGAETSRSIIKALEAVNAEDIAVLSGLARPDLPLGPHHEIHLPPDNVSAAYRKRLRELGLGQATPA